MQVVIPRQPRLVASKVEERCVVLERCKGEREIGLGGVGILQGVPKGVAGAEEGAADFAPVALRVLEGGHAGARVGADAWPAGLGDPDFLTIRNALGLSDSSVEVLAGLIDGVGPGGLKVRETVMPKPVDRLLFAC
jgi:hypothetical protein